MTGKIMSISTYAPMTTVSVIKALHVRPLPR